MRFSSENWSRRTIRIVYLVAAFLAFLVTTYHILDLLLFKGISNDQCVWRAPERGKRGLVISDVIPGGVTDLAGIRNGDTLLEINGRQIDLRTAGSILNALPAGATATYLVARGTSQFHATISIVKLFEVFSFSLYLLGLGFLVVGTVVVLTKPDGNIQRMFARYGIVCMLVFGMFTLNLDAADPAWKNSLFALTFLLPRIFIAPVMIGFFLHFPVRHPLLDRRWIRPALYIVGLVPLLFFLFSRVLALGQQATLYLASAPITFFVTGLCFFVAQYAARVPRELRPRLRPVVIGVIAGVLVFSYIAILTAVNPFAFFLRPTFMLPILLIVLTPVMFGYAIFRYRLMDIDLVVERSLIYGVVTASLAAIYFAVVFGIGSLIALVMGNSDSKILSAAALIVIAFVFDPIKRRVQDSIDRTFYRDRRDYQRALLEFSQELPRYINLEQIMDVIVARISGTMHVDKIAVIVCGEHHGLMSMSRNIDRECCDFSNTRDGLLEHLRLNRTAQTLYFLGEESGGIVINEADQQKILRSGIVLALPMLIQDRLIGLIAVGPKLSGKVYSQDDIDLLTTVASQAAIAIENSRLHRSEIEKEKIEEELGMARRIQQGLLPKATPRVAGLDVTGITIPASFVGGDYFDFITLDPKHLLAVVADVSGKGMSAALYMSKVQGMIQLAAGMYRSPREMLIHVNRLLYGGIERNSFITMILGLFDVERGCVRVCRAGHNKAILGLGDGISELSAGGIGLGLERGVIFEETLQEVEIPLKRGSLFVFYSDGLSEAMNTDRAELGEDALCNVIGSNGGRSARELQDALIAEAARFRGDAEQNDDMTIVVVKADGLR